MLFLSSLFLVSYNGETWTECLVDDSPSKLIYHYFITKIYAPLELTVFLCLPLLINIVCTVIIVRSLRIRMRAAKQFRPSKPSINSLPERSFHDNLQRWFSFCLPATPTRSSIYSCLCFQVQCRRHTDVRLKMGRTKQSLIKYDDEDNQTTGRPRSMTIVSCLSQETRLSQQAITTAALNTARTSHILNKQHRSRRLRDIHLSAMLIGLNIFYIFLNLPFNLYQTFAKGLLSEKLPQCDFMLMALLLDVLQQTFFSTNFFLYVLTNRRFREELSNAIRNLLPHRRQPPHSQSKVNGNDSCGARMSTSHPSAMILLTTSTGDNQLNTTTVKPNRDSLNSDLALPEALTMEQQAIVTLERGNRFVSSLVMFKDQAAVH